MLDLKGTLYTREGLIAGAVAAVDGLRGLADGVRFLTNTDSQSDVELLGQLRDKGLDVGAEELFTPVNAAVAFVEGVGGGPVLVVGSEAVTRQIGQSLELAGEPGSARHVIVGDCRASLSYGLLDEAFQALHGGAELVALQAGRFFLSGGRPHLDTGAVVAGLAYASGLEAHVVGKPAVAFLAAAVDSVGLVPGRASDVWVVGDDVSTDVAMGQAFGATTVQVRTGKYRADQESGATYVIDSIADLPNLLAS